MSQNTTLNSELFANLVVEAQMAAYESSVARQIVTVFDAPVNAGKVLQVPVWARVSATSLTEGTAASATNTDTTQALITLGEIGVYAQITDMLRDSSYSNVAATLGAQTGMAIAEKMDADVFALFSAFDEVGPGAGQELTVAHLLKAAATLRNRRLTGPFYAVISPLAAYNVKRELSGAGASSLPALSNAGNQVLTSGYIGTISGIQVFESSLVAASGTDSIGAVFHSGAIGSAMRGTLTYEATRQAQNRATDLMVSAVTGQAILQASFGVKLTSDSTI
jgi:N4-gp56 family major capsid protein